MCIFIIRDRVISWSFASTCGFKGIRKGTPFAAQTVAGNAIQAVLDQGMQRAEVMIKGPSLKRDATLRAIRRYLYEYETNMNEFNFFHYCSLIIVELLAQSQKEKGIVTLHC
ncbi:hypothetical protein ES319_D02G106800v1 [Gossypium barbadense]|uniref:Uncharacterized protein n=2 Tax=Gossypium TaxID=3633 RepID=A0A5J5SD25_GOSBA|nr:hypothetical protein ES319_D02G106800v1 [Gossypium barbadense]TYG79105.1 hypothetical protein ES288_D02G114700v1 [Gossypium darwinii]